MKNFDLNVMALRTMVPFGMFEIEGYLLPKYLWTSTNKFGVSQTQAVLLVHPGYDRNRGAAKYNETVSTKVAQELAPTGIQVHREVKVESAKGDASKVNLVPVDQLVLFLKICKHLGSNEAENLLDDLAGLSLQQLFHDAFELEFGIESRQKFLLEWQGVRQRLRDVHGGMQQAALRRGHPASKVHDLMTVLIFGDTAEAARMKQLVDPEADVTIGLNHQEEIAGMNQLIQAKKNYAYMKNLEGTWQEQVQRAVAKR